MTTEEVREVLMYGTGCWGSVAKVNRIYHLQGVTVGEWSFQWKFRMGNGRNDSVTAIAHHIPNKRKPEIFRDIARLEDFFRDVCPMKVSVAHHETASDSDSGRGKPPFVKQVRVTMGHSTMDVETHPGESALWVGFTERAGTEYEPAKVSARTGHDDAVQTFSAIDNGGYRMRAWIDFSEIAPMIDALLESDLDDDMKAGIEWFLRKRTSPLTIA